MRDVRLVMQREHLVPGPDHPITVEPTDRHVTVRVGDTVIAETDSAVTLREAGYDAVQYVPLDDVDPAVLRTSETTTYCPYKGEASYFDIAVGDDSVTDGVWTYTDPFPAVADIRGHVAFYPDRVTVDAG
ncbi:DUF427 domain-containing protein [uncultured Williamsia sp.]|uniref:DUF427 domain-containing protein n=1 Tax=uncultured Williamsia sp. TaxID=259311 RepID=UPI00261D0D16|nr:DUF427 domain-containing protein [uncultured Williamsia sp.]